jgi:hypothetical protein
MKPSQEIANAIREDMGRTVISMRFVSDPIDATLFGFDRQYAVRAQLKGVRGDVDLLVAVRTGSDECQVEEVEFDEFPPQSRG